MDSFALYGFRIDSRIHLIRWKPGDTRYPSPLDKFLSKNQHRSGDFVQAQTALPITAKDLYTRDHPWDWRHQ